MTINTEFLKFHIEDNGLVHCANVDEYMELFELLKQLGFSIGFTPGKSDRWRNVGFGHISTTQIHACGESGGDMMKGRTILKFSDFVIDDDEEISPENLDVLFS